MEDHSLGREPSNWFSDSSRNVRELQLPHAGGRVPCRLSRKREKEKLTHTKAEHRKQCYILVLLTYEMEGNLY